MTGQMLAFDKVRHLMSFASRARCLQTPAHEPRPCRHRRIPPREAKACEGSTSTGRKRTRSRRNRREADVGFSHSSRHAHHLLFGGWTAARRSCVEVRGKRTRRSWCAANTGSWTRHQQTCGQRLASRLNRARSRSWGSTTAWWLRRIPAGRLPWWSSARIPW